MSKKVISTRLEPNHIAKARDGLRLRGYEREQLANISNIVRLTFLHGLAELQKHNESKTDPSEESKLWISQKIKQTKRKNTLSLADIIK